MQSDIPPHPDDYLDLKQLSALTSLSPRTLRAKVHDPVDPLPAFRVGGKLLFKRSEAIEYIESHRIKPTDVQGAVEDILQHFKEDS